MHPAPPLNAQHPSVIAATAPPSDKDLELAMAINASLHPTPPLPNVHLGSSQYASTSSTSSTDNSITGDAGPPVTAPQKGSSSSGWEYQEASLSNSPAQYVQTENINVPLVQTDPSYETTAVAPSAPPIGPNVVDEGPIHYPSIDFDPVEVSVPTVDTLPARGDGKKEDNSCVICLDAPVEGACIPCGHMALFE